jgi:hypothetical protein
VTVPEPIAESFVVKNGVSLASLAMCLLVQVVGLSYQAGAFQGKIDAVNARVQKIETEGTPLAQATKQIVEWHSGQLAELKSDSRSQTQAVGQINLQMGKLDSKIDTVLDRLQSRTNPNEK